MHWILIMWLFPGWQIAGTGSGGVAMSTAVFDDRDACVDAMNTIHKMQSSLNAVCVPSSKH
jgi:hypothetical protein